MKILFFSGSLSGGGAERVLANITNELSQQGHEIIISLNENKRAYEVKNVKILLAQQREWYKGNNPFRRLIRHFSRKQRNFFHTKNVIKIEQPDVIVTFQQCNFFPIILFHGKIPIVHSEHNAYDRKQGFLKYFNRFFTNRFFDKVCVLTPFDQGYAIAKGLNNTIVMPNPNTFEAISTEEYDDFFKLRKNIIICGRVDAWRIKGIDLAIKLFARIAKDNPEVNLDIVGYGSDSSINTLKKVALENQVADRVHFLGQSNNICDLYRHHQLLILPSRTEGFPMVIIEAMSQGLPCIAFERLANSIILNGLDGYLATDRNLIEMSNILSDILKDENIRYKLGLEAKKNVERFSSYKIGIRWEKMLNSLK